MFLLVLKIAPTWKKLTPIKSKPVAEKRNLYPTNRFNRMEKSMKERPISLSETSNYMDPQNIIKTAKNGHVLMLIKKSRLKGICVQCLKKSDGTKKFPKIISHCPQCPGGVWLCEPCFDRCHN